MNPITTLAIGHIGKKVRIVDESVTLTGILFAIDAERQAIHERAFSGEESVSVGAWENITVTVGINRVNLHPGAQWEEA